VRLCQNLGGLLGGIDALDARQIARGAAGADDAHADGRGHAGEVLADGAEAEDAEGAAVERRGHAAGPGGGLVVVHDGGEGLGDVEERAKDVLRHALAVGAARGGQGECGRQVGQGEPGFDAGGEALDPAQLGHGGQQAGRGGQ